MFRARSTLLFLFLLLIPWSHTFGQAFASRPIVLSGEPAPTMQGVLETQRFATFYAASIDERGNVGILGTVDDDNKLFGGWYYSDGSLSWNHQQGVRSPDNGPTYSSGVLPIPYEQGVAINAVLNGDLGAIAGPVGAMRPLLIPGRTMPGVGQPLRLAELKVSDNGQIGLRGYGDNGLEAIWIVDDTVEELTADHLVVTTGDSAPEIHPTATFSNLAMQAINNLGEIVALVGFDVAEPEFENGDSIWAFSASSRRLLAKPNDLAPGTDSTFREFGLVVNNDIGTTAFAARTQDGLGLWLNLPGEEELTPIAVTGQTIPGVETAIDVVPPFSSLNINDKNQVAFSMWLEGERVGSSWIGSPTEVLTPIALRGVPVPGLDGWVYERPGVAELNNNGLAVFEAGVIPEGGQFRDLQTALMVRQSNGETTPLLITGEPFEVSPGDLRTLEDFNVELFYNQGALNDAGQLAAALRFDNDTSGVFVFDLVNPDNGGDPDPGNGSPIGVESAWTQTQGGLWNSANNWTEGVPTGPGRIAVFDAKPVAPVTISLPADQDIAIGGLIYRAPIDGVQIRGDMSLNLQQADNTESPYIRTEATGGRLVVGAKVNAATDWIADVQGASVLEISGDLSGGSIIKTGSGELRLGGANVTWDGEVSLEEGLLVVTHEQALGTATTPTTIPSDREVRFVVDSLGPDNDQTFEPFVLDGGRLTNWRSTEFHGPITLRSSSEIDQPNVYGEIDGAGSLTFLGRGQVYSATSYTGDTFVQEHLTVHHRNALGSTDGDTFIQNGATIVAREDLAEHIVVQKDGTFILENEGAYTGSITLQDGGSLVSSSRALESTLIIDGSGLLIGGELALVGDVMGHGDVFVDTGHTTVQGTIGTEIRFVVPRNRRLTLDNPLATGTEIELFGNLTLKQDASLQTITLHDRFELVTEGDATLSLDELPIAEGIYDLNLRTTNPIRVNQNANFRRLGNYDKAIYLDRGNLNVSGPDGLGTTDAPTIVASHDAELVLNHRSLATTPLNEEIQLDNASGYSGSGGLHISDGATLSGDLQLGSVGSIINARDGVISGQIHGGSLTVTQGRLTLTGTGHSYAGPTVLAGAKLELAELGTLEATDAIELHTLHPGNGNEAALILQNQTARNDDRVADNIPIRSSGGLIQLIGNSGAEGILSETLGQLELVAGHTEISRESGMALNLGELTRHPRTTLGIGDFNAENELFINLGDLNDGIVPGWATMLDADFITVDDSNRISRFTDYVAIGAATENDNVLVTRANTVPSSKTVNSLNFQNEGRLTVSDTLTVDTGGVLVSGLTEIRGGQLTAGPGSDYDLYFHGLGAVIESQIVDNGDNPVGIVVDAFGLRLMGDNTYTGGTTVVNTAELFLVAPNAIPSHSSVDVDGGDIYFDVPGGGEVAIGELTVRRGGRLINQSGMTLNAQAINAQAGLIQVPLTGGGTFDKNGPGVFDVEDASQFTGDITVNAGQLRIFNLAQHSNVVVKSNGSLDIIANPGRTTLQGGNLSGGRYQGIVEVESNSFVQPFQRNNTVVSISGDLIGGGNLLVKNAELALSGDNSNYAGMVQFMDATLIPGHQNALGQNGVLVGPRSKVVLGSAAIAGIVQLDGGTIENSRSGAAASLLGTVEVLSSGTISPQQLNRGSNIHLNDIVMRAATSLVIDASGPSPNAPLGTVELSGNLELPGAEPNQTASLWIDGETTISGTIVAGGPFSELTVSGEYGTAALFTASYAVPEADDHLRIVDGAKELISLDITGGQVSGNGTLHNSVSLNAASKLSPGNDGTGSLTVTGAVTFQTESTFAVQLQNLAGDTGKGWDFLQAAGGLTFADGSTIEIQSLGHDGEIGPTQGFNPMSDLTLTIATGAIVEQGDVQLRTDTFRRENVVPTLYGFSIRVDEDSLLLDYGMNGDANGDDLVNGEDVEFLCSSTNLVFDFTDDGLLNFDDIVAYLDAVHGTKPGDVDLDGSVQFRDFLTLSDNFGGPGGWSDGDFDCSGDVAFPDFLLLSMNFGHQSATASVPEPQGYGWIFLPIAFRLCRFRRRHGLSSEE